MDSNEAPEVRRFTQEAFRRVGIVSAGWGLSAEKMALIPRIGLGNDAVARREIVKTRIESSVALGVWVCPRVVPQDRRARRPAARGHPPSGPPLHPREYPAPGICTELDAQSGRACGAVLRPRSRHLDEFAASVGFLEQTGDNYIRGKFGLAAEFIQQMASESRPGHVFNATRSYNGLLFYAFVERHGDLLLPTLGAILWQPDDMEETFRSLVRRSLVQKASRLESSSLPRNPAFHRAKSEIDRHKADWGALAPQDRRGGGRAPTPLEDKTISGYFSRTVSNLEDLGFLERQGRRALQLTPLGSKLVRALKEQGLLASEDRTEIPPSFEATHDAFAVTWDRYLAVFSPPITCGTLEGIVREAVLPGVAAPYWDDSAADADDLRCAYREAVTILAERLTGAARLDAVRLALFLYGLGTGRPLQLEGQSLREADGDPNANAAVEIALANPAQYLLGHARMGKRFWSVALVRR